MTEAAGQLADQTAAGQAAGSANGQPPAGPRRVVLSVPGLADPPEGGGCCAVGRDDVLLEEIDSWPGLLVLDVDPEQAVAVVLVTPGHDEDLPAALDALADRGLPAAVATDDPASG